MSNITIFSLSIEHRRLLQPIHNNLPHQIELPLLHILAQNLRNFPPLHINPVVFLLRQLQSNSMPRFDILFRLTLSWIDPIGHPIPIRPSLHSIIVVVMGAISETVSVFVGPEGDDGELL